MHTSNGFLCQARRSRDVRLHLKINNWPDVHNKWWIIIRYYYLMVAEQNMNECWCVSPLFFLAHHCHRRVRHPFLCPFFSFHFGAPRIWKTRFIGHPRSWYEVAVVHRHNAAPFPILNMPEEHSIQKACTATVKWIQDWPNKNWQNMWAHLRDRRWEQWALWSPFLGPIREVWLEPNAVGDKLLRCKQGCFYIRGTNKVL